MSTKWVRVAFFHKGGAVCALADGVECGHGEKCVVETDYGLDAGTCHGPAEPPPAAGTNAHVPRAVRVLTPADQVRLRENADLAEQAIRQFAELLAQAGTPVKPLLAHYTLDRARLLLVYGAPEQADCRRIVGKLQWDLNTRVEVRHVGVRDEAAVACGIGPCGSPLCCASWLRSFRAVNVRMARAQEVALNPVVLNGCCGRLKCCLRYEYDTYQEAGAGLPENGTAVCGAECEGVVVGRNVLRRRLTVRTREHGLRHVSADEVAVAIPPRPAPAEDGKEARDDHTAGEWTEPGAAREA